jgi:hypothetical protein
LKCSLLIQECWLLSRWVSLSLSRSLSCIKKSMLQNLIFLVCYVYVGIKISGDVIAA